ncbi:MAG: hypothetical protein ABIH86_07465 [Planctomycetota bacterium]
MAKGQSILWMSVALLVATVCASGADGSGIGIRCGIGYEVFNDSRFSGIGSVFSIDALLTDNVFLVIETERQGIAYDDVGVNLDGTALYTGLGLEYSAGYAFAGIAFGKAEIDVQPLILETAAYADMRFGVNLVQGAGARVDYRVSVILKYRFVQFADITIVNPAIENLNGFQAALTVGAMF